jgi:hypothetical protein
MARPLLDLALIARPRISLQPPRMSATTRGRRIFESARSPLCGILWNK